MKETSLTASDRGQAYTLEGFIGAMVVLMAVLFALQSLVLTPTSAGLADRSVQSQIQQEAQDSLVVAAEDGDLSELLRYWDESDNYSNFVNATDHAADGEDPTYRTYSDTSLANESEFGTILNETFGKKAWDYNVELHYTNGSDLEKRSIVYQGGPPSDALTVSYVVTLYDDQYVQPGRGTTLTQAAKEGEPAIPPADNAGPNPVYNVVEVRLIIW
ncbi:DUF7288 family protein [Halopiger djelfimassiliensis]|uniref:DUF7288 family protein n=1 Tax=Halopiger djelfimassiliensis TaxID=1293047 RepID=UPI0006782DFA|nr:hypothetical protein [Halopiger djelfimassiliensis]